MATAAEVLTAPETIPVAKRPACAIGHPALPRTMVDPEMISVSHAGKAASTFLAVFARMASDPYAQIGISSSIMATTPATFGVAALVPFIIAVY
jgi:hypothetical protein